MKPIITFCLVLVLMPIIVGCKEKLPEPTISLYQAAYNGDIDQVQLHILKGADVNAKNNYDLTPVKRAVEKGHNKIVEILLKHEAGEGELI